MFISRYVDGSFGEVQIESQWKLTCYRCKKNKHPEDFEVSRDGYHHRCLVCRDYCLEYYKTHRQESIDRAARSQNKDRNKTNKYKRELNRKNPLNICLQQARRRAKKLGIPFDITLEDLGTPTVCPVLGI